MNVVVAEAVAAAVVDVAYCCRMWRANTVACCCYGMMLLLLISLVATIHVAAVACYSTRLCIVLAGAAGRAAARWPHDAT